MLAQALGDDAEEPEEPVVRRLCEPLPPGTEPAEDRRLCDPADVDDIRENSTGRCGKPEQHEPHWWGIHFWCDGQPQAPVDDDERHAWAADAAASYRSMVHRDSGRIDNWSPR